MAGCRRAASRSGGALVLALVFGVAAPPAEPPGAALPDPAAAAEAIAAGDAHYARRAEGATGGTALPFHADGALVEYRRALALDPSSKDARVRLMRALFFRAGFCGPMEERDKVRLLDEAKEVAEKAIAASTAEVHLWAAVSWGQWAVHHRLSAAWHGAPKRIRDLAETVLSIDPGTAQFGAYIILGRLHCEAPRVPGLTGWVSCEKGLAFLRQGLARAPDNQALVYFLAEELLSRDPSRREEARELLQRCSASTPRPDFPVEDAHYAERARERLAQLR